MMFLKQYIVSLYRTPTPLEMATAELAEAERKLLAALTARDYAETEVDYNRRRITRLRQYINEASVEEPREFSA